MVSKPPERLAERICGIVVAGIVLFFPAACLILDRSDSLSLILLGVIGLWAGFRYGFRGQLSRWDWLFVGIFGLFFLVVLVSFEFGTQTDDGFRLLGRYLRLLFALPVLLALRRYRPSPVLVWSGLGLASVVLGADTVWEQMRATHFLRPEGDTNVAILFGDLAALTAFAFAAGYIYIDARLPRSGPWLVSICAIAGVLASFLSGTRGAWIAMPALLIVFVFARHMLRLRTVLLGSIAVAALFMLSYFIPQTHVRDRIGVMATQVESYFMVTDDLRHLTGKPVCLNRPGMLRALRGSGLHNISPAIQLDVVEVKDVNARILRKQGCALSDALEIRNPTRKPVAALFISHISDGSGRKLTASLLVRGRGAIHFFYQDAPTARIKSKVFHRITIGAPAVGDYPIRVLIRPRATLDIVPIERYPGEYSNSLIRSSIGKRLEMWRAAFMVFLQHPLLGSGTGSYQDETLKLAQDGRIASMVTVYDHPHNDYFDALSNRGLLGLLALLLMLVVPGALFFRALPSTRPAQASAALAGLLVVVGFAIFSLTETMFIHSVTIGWYLIMTAIFLSFVDEYGEGAEAT